MIGWERDAAVPDAFRDRVVTGDARRLARRIPDQSVELILSDPVYDRPHDYAFLGRLARRVLRPGGNLLVWTRVRDASDRQRRIERAGLTWHWTVPYVVLGSRLRLIQYKLFNKWQPVLWFGRKGERAAPNRYWTDYLCINQGADLLPDRKTHRWAKHPEAVAQLIDAFTNPGDLVLDPFAGSGGIPRVARMLERRAIGFELDPLAAADADGAVQAARPHRFLPTLSPFYAAAAQTHLDLEANSDGRQG